ncbi:chaperonin 10-like protein [Schizothecium vesticola]|uniref:Chaperonin 10-like protein n=1 Tax=Schizothecium vesticola TaxID=314040 RepID=A0AA40KCD1_9PEZI|nr:chaperonin 10-like protein [Schizothecium vesticola]
MSSTIQASVLHGARDLRIESRPVPALPPSSVLVKIATTGLCGSDLHYYNHFRNGDIQVLEPLTLGHESAGIVQAVGADVTGLAAGDRVALEVGLPCGACELCTAGRYNICRGMKFRSSAKGGTPHAQGTLQEVVVQGAGWCHKLPDGVSLTLGALVEPLAVALHACKRGQLPEGATVLVFGAGAVGLLCAAVSKAVTKAKVVIADIQAERVKFAVDNGFADGGVVVPMKRPETTEAKLDFAKEVAEMVRTVEVDGKPVGEVNGTYECTGVEACLQASIYTTGPGGKIMIIGMGNPVQTLPISAASLREVDLVGVFRYANTYPRAIELLASGNPLLPDLTKLVTHRFSGLDSIPKAFEMAARVKDDDGNLVLKAMVDM